MANTTDRIQSGILGDINPVPSAKEHVSGSTGGGSDNNENDDVTEGVTGGVGTEVGGTRNYRQGTGVTGGDIGNRPE